MSRSKEFRVLTEEIRRLRAELESDRQRFRKSSLLARTVMLWGMTAALGLVVVALLGIAFPAVPAVQFPGEVGVAMVGGAERSSAVTVITSFDASKPNGTSFNLALTLTRPGQTIPTNQPRVAFFFCGALRKGLRVREINNEEISPLRPVRRSTITVDGALGVRTECEVMTAHTTGLQVILKVTSHQPSGAISGKRGEYTFPGIHSLPSTAVTGRPERVNNLTLRSLPSGSSSSVSIDGLPNDATITSSIPQLPESGQPGWSSVLQGGSGIVPNAFGLSVSLSGADDRSQLALFLAGVTAGLGGGTFTAAVPLTVELIGRRLRHHRAPHK